MKVKGNMDKNDHKTGELPILRKIGTESRIFFLKGLRKMILTSGLLRKYSKDPKSSGDEAVTIRDFINSTMTSYSCFQWGQKLFHCCLSNGVFTCKA